MPNSFKLLLSSLLFSAFYFSAVTSSMAAGFANPVLKASNAGCRIGNLRHERFTSETGSDDRLKVCEAIDKIAFKLNSTHWSPNLANELQGVWQVFSTEAVTLRLMPSGTSSRMLAMAEPFPSGDTGRGFEAAVYVRPDSGKKDSFFQVMLHELRHVYDFHSTWKNQAAVNSLELERRAFLLMGKLSQETPEKESFSGIPKFWKDSWQKLSLNEISYKREEAVNKYLQGNKLYRDLEQANQVLDFSYLRKASPSKNTAVAAVAPADWQFVNADAKKDGERLPNRARLPQTASLLPQNIQELSFNLEKPKNPRDEKEILRVALANEKKLYYGMNNFVYDQKLQFQCWKKGKSIAAFAENNIITRTDKGDALFQTVSSSAAPCISNYRDLKTDFTETFWVSPALEQMPIRFAGFAEVDGKNLARYTVLQPDAKLYGRLAAQYGSINPFRVFVGTIFVSPEDGQIVKFWGTSFPEDTVTGANSKKVFGSYSVTALRQKLDISSGVWVTVHIGTVAVANFGNDPRPFSYTVKFENYRQSTTDMRILDDVVAENDAAGGSK